jgi:hypothetical protein
MIDFTKAAEGWRKNGPRINSLAANFSAIASGNSGVPSHTPFDDADALQLYGNDFNLSTFHNACRSRFGKFGLHFIASVPYALQELCCIGSAAMLHLSNISKTHNRDTYFHSVDSAEGAIARTMSALSGGAVHTLTNSSTAENSVGFQKGGAPQEATFFVGSFFDLSPEVLRTRSELRRFAQGFDIILEDTSFQMFAPNRKEQVAWLRRNLREDGIVLFWEKCSMADVGEYQRREEIKDEQFKARYFSSHQIAHKKSTILHRMEDGQVPLEKLVEGISFSFQHAVTLWNSGNFYVVAASNDPAKLQNFCSYLLRPYIPSQFLHTPLPQTLLGPDLNLSFREPTPNPAVASHDDTIRAPVRSGAGLPGAPQEPVVSAEKLIPRS